MTTDLAALAFHAPYTTFNSVIIGDGLGLLIANIGSFSLTSLPTLLLWSWLLVSITLLMSYSLTLSFRCRILTRRVTLVRDNVETVSITSRSQSPFQSSSLVVSSLARPSLAAISMLHNRVGHSSLPILSIS